MPRSAASIQAEISAIETRLAASSSMVSSTSSDGTSINFEERSKLEKRLDQLYQQLDRANGSAPLLVRGVVTGLRRR